MSIIWNCEIEIAFSFTLIVLQSKIQSLLTTLLTLSLI